MGYSPWGHRESDRTEPLTHAHKYDKPCAVPIWQRRENALIERTRNLGGP